MAIHRDLPASEVHEAKQIIDALTSDAGKVITPSSVDDGVGELRFLTPADIDGLSAALTALGDTNTAQDARLDDLEVKAYGGKTINNNSTAIAVAAAVDPNFLTAGDFVQVTGIFESPDIAPVNNMTINTNGIQVITPGVYAVHFWASLTHSVNGSIVGFNLGVNGTVNTARPATTRAPNSTEPTDISAHAYITLAAGNEVQLFVASTNAGDIVLRNGRCSLELVEAL